MKKVKTDWRATLGEESLPDSMRVHLKSAQIIALDPIPAIGEWNSSGKQAKRPNVPYGSRSQHLGSDSDSDRVMIDFLIQDVVYAEF